MEIFAEFLKQLGPVGGMGWLMAAVTSAYIPRIMTDDTGMHIGHNSSVRTLELQTNNTTRVTLAGNGNYAEFSTGVCFDPGSAVPITADNTAVTVGGRSYIQITGNSTPENRTITLSDGVLTGHVLSIHCTTAGGVNGVELADSGNCRLSATWSATLDDTITLIWSGSAWIELARSNN